MAPMAFSDSKTQVISLQSDIGLGFIQGTAEGFLYTKDGDVVIPTEVYDAMVAQEMLEEQTRVIDKNGYLTKRRKTNQKATKQDTGWKSV
ncbi:hypothetical protein Tco_0934193 [Tanacetum coccineum]